MTDDMRKLIDEVQILGRLRDAGVLDPKAHAGLMDAAPALAAEVERQDARLAEVERERDEALLALAAEQGRQEGAPSGWEYGGQIWHRGRRRAKPCRDGWEWWIRGDHGVLMAEGRALTARAAMRAADAATAPAEPAPTRG